MGAGKTLELISMVNSTRRQESLFSRKIFKSGEYRRFFNPDDRCNPFFKIYGQKNRDAIKIIQQPQDFLQILDIGGGYGRLSLSLASSPRRKLVLADISMDMLRQATNSAVRSDTLEAVNADAHQLPIRNKSFDIVVGLDLFCHLERPEQALSEFYRVLKNDGMLILDSTNSNPLWTLFYPRYLGKNPIRWIKTIRFRGVCPGWETIVAHYSKKNFFSFVRDAGFRIIKNLNYGPRVCPKWHLVVAQKTA